MRSTATDRHFAVVCARHSGAIAIVLLIVAVISLMTAWYPPLMRWGLPAVAATAATLFAGLLYAAHRRALRQKQVIAALQNTGLDVFLQDTGLLSLLPFGVYVLDREGICCFANECFAHQIGVRREHIIGRGIAAFVPGEVGKRWAQTDREFLDAGAGSIENFTIPRPTGDQVRLQIVRTTLIGTSNTSQAIAGFCHIVAPAGDSAQAAQSDSNDIKRLLEDTDTPVFSLDADGRFASVNAAGERLFGMSATQLLGRRYLDFVKQASRRDMSDKLEAVSRREHCRDYPVTVVDAAGKAIPLAIDATPFFNAEGRFAGTHLLARDNSHRLRTDVQALCLERAVDAAAEAILLTDAEGRIQRVNPAFLRTTGHTAEQVLGETPRILKSGEHDAEFYKGMWTTITSGHAWSGHVINKRRDGAHYHAALTVAPIRDDAGHIAGYVGVQRDVTSEIERERARGEYADAVRSANQELRANWSQMQNQQMQLVRLNRELKHAMKLAQSASQAKSDFLANMSHEIRTPMTAILGFADVLQEHVGLSDSPDHVIEAVQTIQRSGQHLIGIINDILDLSKIESGRVTVQPVEAQLPALLRDTVGLLTHRAEAKGIRLEFGNVTRVPKAIFTDALRLRQALLNLLSNAIKFTETGRVWLDVEYEPTDQRVTFHVNDEGIGLTELQIGRLFEPFSQADTSVTRRFGGTGLGLAITRRIAELLGGTVTVESTPSKGSRFSLTVAAGDIHPGDVVDMSPEPTAARPPAPTAAATTIDGRILLVEDGPDNQRLISLFLRKGGASVVVAENGAKALDQIVCAEEAGMPFDLIVTDMQMPVMDGYALARRLRGQGYTDLPIIALTAHALEGERERCLEAGCDEYLAKPVNRALLLETVAAHLKAAPSEPTEPVKPAKTPVPTF